MAPTTLTKTTPLGSYGSYGANLADLTMTAADVANGNQFVASGNDLVIAHNTGGSAYTITVTSVADPYGRTGNIAAYSLGAGEYAVLGPFLLLGWQQTDGKILISATNAAVKFGVIPL